MKTTSVLVWLAGIAFLLGMLLTWQFWFAIIMLGAIWAGITA